MSLLRLAALSVSSLLIGCAPIPDAADGADPELPCRTTADCEIALAERGPRDQICTSRGIRLESAKDIAACGPMPNMTPTRAEPRMACFRGTCVPIDNK